MKQCGSDGAASWLKVVAAAMILYCTAVAATPLQKPADAVAPETYTLAVVVSPADDEALRGNAGNLTVLTRVDPKLQGGHRLRLLLDGAPRAISGRKPEFHLENIDRGTHSLQLQVIDDSNRVLFTGPPSTFHLLRHSRLHP